VHLSGDTNGKSVENGEKWAKKLRKNREKSGGKLRPRQST